MNFVPNMKSNRNDQLPGIWPVVNVGKNSLFACYWSKCHAMEYTPAKAMEYLSDTSQFPNPACCRIYVKDNKHNSPQNSFVLRHYLFLKACSFHWCLHTENSSYLGILSCRMEAVVFIFHIIWKDSNESKLYLILKKSVPLSVKCTDPQSYSCSPTQFLGGLLWHAFYFSSSFCSSFGFYLLISIFIHSKLYANWKEIRDVDWEIPRSSNLVPVVQPIHDFTCTVV